MMGEQQRTPLGEGDSSEWMDPLRGLEVRPKTIAQSISDELRKRIILGKLAPGLRFTESRLAEWLGVSRTPLREALKPLELEGWIERHRNGGIEVTRQTAEDTYHQFQLRAALEGLIARETAVTLSEEDRDLIASWTKRLAKGAERNDTDSVAHFGSKVHALLISRSRNRSAVQMLNLLRERIDRARNLVITLPGRVDEAAREHAAIGAAVESRDHLAAQAAMTRHILASGVQLLQAMEAHDEAAALRIYLDELPHVPGDTGIAEADAATPNKEHH